MATKLASEFILRSRCKDATEIGSNIVILTFHKVGMDSNRFKAIWKIFINGMYNISLGIYQ